MTTSKPTAAELRAGAVLPPPIVDARIRISRCAYRSVATLILAPLIAIVAPFRLARMLIDLAGNALRPIGDSWVKFAYRAAKETQILILILTGKAKP